MRDVGAGFSYWVPPNPSPSNSNKSSNVKQQPKEKAENLRTDFLFAKHGQVSLEELRRLYNSMPDCSQVGIEEKEAKGENEKEKEPLYENEKQLRRRSAYFGENGEETYVDVEEFRTQITVKSPNSNILPPSSKPVLASVSPESKNGLTDRFSPSIDSGYRSVPRSLDADLHKCASTEANSKPEIHASHIEVKTPNPSHPTNDGAFHRHNGDYAESLSPSAFSERSSSLSSYCSTQAQKHLNGKKPQTTLENSSVGTLDTGISPPVEYGGKLTELYKVPWNERDVVSVLQKGRTKESVGRIAVDVVPRLTYLLQRPLVRVVREMRRLSARLGGEFLLLHMVEG